ncbi:hypothetical protein AVEN_143040-1 [Araneus ventricosus]|uniref:Uncharacterized protein n=1 Tax=Araneus ventricosus TaxID=182803 RepID=A0A4Y2KUM6_ARAVE|nr:hypothetical protein AVEN_143040-1 [Araneus ventricosus]
MLQVSMFQVPKTVRSQVERESFYCIYIRKLLSDSLFSETMRDKEKEAWDSFKDVVHRFLENTKDPLYETNVQRMLTAYEAQGCKTRLKVHFLLSHVVKGRVKDFTRMPVISRDDTKEDGTSTAS